MTARSSTGTTSTYIETKSIAAAEQELCGGDAFMRDYLLCSKSQSRTASSL